MQLLDISAVVTGGASGLGLATAKRLLDCGAIVTLVDLPSSAGEAIAEELAKVHDARVGFAPADVTDEVAMAAAIDCATERAPLRVLVHCAGRGATTRVVEKDGTPGPLEAFSQIVHINLVGTFNALRLAAARMATNRPIEGERGVCLLTASIAAWEGQIGQTAYASAKAGVVGMTLVAARDLARRLIRVNAIAPGIFDTPILSRLGPEVLGSLASQVPHPARLGMPDEFAKLALSMIDNGYINGETVRLDGAIRMPPR